MVDSKFVKDVLTIVDQSDANKVKSMILNYNVNADDFEDAFELVKYRIKQDN